MRFIQVRQKFLDYDDPHDHGEALFECATTAQNYARQLRGQGKEVALRLVSMQGGYTLGIQLIAPDEQIVCVSCLAKEKPCNLPTTRAYQHSANWTQERAEHDGFRLLTIPVQNEL